MMEALLNAFAQADMIRGWRYLDDTGHIMNRWDNAFPEKSVGIEGMIMRNRDAAFEALKINPFMIWLHLSLPDGLAYVIDISESTIREVSEILGVNQYRRVGLRFQYFHGIDKDKLGLVVPQVAQNLFSSKWTEDSAIKSVSPSRFEFMLQVADEPISVNLRANVVGVSPESRARKIMPDLPETGIIIDLDLYRRGIIDIVDLRGIMKRVRSWLSDELPHIEDKVMGGVNLE